MIALRRSKREEVTGGLLSRNDWERRSVKWLFGSSQVLVFVVLILIGLGPIVWLVKGARSRRRSTP